jgi:hypothetical protein
MIQFGTVTHSKPVYTPRVERINLPKVTKSMELIGSRESASCVATQELANIFMEPRSVHMSSPVIPNYPLQRPLPT